MVANHTKKLPHRKHFARKLFWNFVTGTVVLLISLMIGLFGYRHYFGLSWTDSLYNSSMILTGMGPANVPPSDAAKIFASFYAIYSGVAFLSSVAIIFSPIVHRFLHKFRLDVEE
jgi:hypothetical protein